MEKQILRHIKNLLNRQVCLVTADVIFLFLVVLRLGQHFFSPEPAAKLRLKLEADLLQMSWSFREGVLKFKMSLGFLLS